MTLRVGWFSTGRGEGSRLLLTAAVEAIRSGELDAEIAFVFSNRERGEHEATDGFLDLAASFGSPVLTLSSRRFRRERDGARSQPGRPLPPWRLEYDRQVAELIAPHPFDVGVLAGYMLIFTAEMSRRYPLLNLHPAAPDGPIGTWQEVTHQLIDSRAERSGVMIHLATEELDRGPLVTYCTYPLRGSAFDALWADHVPSSAPDETSPLFLEIRRHGAARELPFMIATLRAFADGRLRTAGRAVLDASGRPRPHGLDLTDETEAALQVARPGGA